MGSLKTGGRKKGTPNKRSLDFYETLATQNIDILEQILNESFSLPPEEKIKVYLALLPYVYPKKKPVEVPFQFSEHLSLLSEDELKTLHSEVAKRLGLLPNSMTLFTEKEFKEKIREAIKKVDEDI